MFDLVPLTDGDGRQIDLGIGFHHLLHIPAVHGFLSQVQRFLVGDQGQEPQHLPPHGAILDLAADDLDGGILLMKITERNDTDERVHESIGAIFHHLHDLTGYVCCIRIFPDCLGFGQLCL